MTVLPIVIDKLAWLHIKDRKVLHARSRGKDVWYIPGGKRESGESDEEALCREIREELCIELRKESLRHIETFRAQAHGKPEGVMVQMTCYSGEYDGEMRPSAEIEEIGWFTYDDRHRASPVDRLILDWLKAKALID